MLTALLSVFIERGWSADALEDSFETLYETGNMGSAAMLFVLARTLPTIIEDRVAALAFGPGVTIEWGLLARGEEG